MGSSTPVKLGWRFGLALVAMMAVIPCAKAARDPREIPGYPLDIQSYDAREVAILPKYCKYSLTFRGRVPGGNDEAEIKRWYALQGPTFNHMHHYCFGLMDTNRALYLARTVQTRSFYLRASIVEFDYVIDRAPDDFLLLPEILTKKGENLVRLDEGPSAVNELLRAIALKPDYWPPYASLSDYYKTVGDTAKARAILEKGLVASPEAAALKRRLHDLDPSHPK